MDTTIKVDSTVRDRLAELAGDRGITMREMVAQLTASVPTRAEVQARSEVTLNYVREHLVPGISEADIAEGEKIWQAVEAQTAQILAGTSQDALPADGTERHRTAS